MSAGIEALYIFNQHHSPILQHIYRSRPPSASAIILQYLAHPAPRPPLIYLPNLAPPTVLLSLLHSGLLFISTTSAVETEPLLVLEFLHTVVDALEEFLGTPLLETKIENGYDVVAQLLAEMCDAGAVSATEPNALRDVVEVSGWVGKLLGGVGLPGSSLAPAAASNTAFGPQQNASFNAQPSISRSLPWRRANVRYTSNELYVDIIETLSVIVAPSGRPLSAFANGTIAFTSKISGLPDLLLTLTSSAGGKAHLDRLIELPVFHPCVRLARWRQRPGELSFVPPDGRFVLAGYEVDLLPFMSGDTTSIITDLHLPVSVHVRTGLGTNQAEFEVRLLLTNTFPGTSGAGAAATFMNSGSRSSSSRRIGSGSGSGGVGGGVRLPSALSGRLGGPSSSSAFEAVSNPSVLGGVTIDIPLPSNVRTVTDIYASRGEAHYTPTDRLVQWRVSSKETAQLVGGRLAATLRCTVVKQPTDGDDDDDDDADDETRPIGDGFNMSADAYQDDDHHNGASSRQRQQPGQSRSHGHPDHTRLYSSIDDLPNEKGGWRRRGTKGKRGGSNVPMPSSASISFQAQGWLASGLKVDSLQLLPRTSRGLAEGVKPYKGVKYLTVSRGGVEIRC